MPIWGRRMTGLRWNRDIIDGNEYYNHRSCLERFGEDWSCHCSGSLEPESSCHDRDWIMELPMEADILIFAGILTPEDASVASCLLRLRRKLLRSSTRMRLPILNSVRAWARLFHVCASRGLRHIAAEPQSAQGGTMEQSSRWAKICHFGEVGHWSRSLAAFFFRKFLGD